MSSPISINKNQIQSTPVVIGPPPGVNNIYVRPKRPQQIFQPAQQHLSTVNNINMNVGQHVNQIMNNQIVNNLNNQQLVPTQQPRMRHQQNNQRPPPGSVNLERSYQICQAVIQNSTNPNRQQLNNQLKPPSAMGQKKF